MEQFAVVHDRHLGTLNCQWPEFENWPRLGGVAYYTPLRYPGGKRRLASAIKQLLGENGLTDVQYVEPFAGGAAVALTLLLDEYASSVHINDLSRPVFAFWHSVLNETADLCRRIELAEVTMGEWRAQRVVYDNRETADLADLGFAALFLNRTNRSGIIDGGVIGGKNQTGAWGIDARFNKKALIQRIQRIGRYNSRITLYQSDALNFTTDTLPGLGKNTFAFYDPPYIDSGEDLYLNLYQLDDHRRLARAVKRLKQPWVMTYDISAIKHGILPRNRSILYGLKYTTQGRYEGREVMFLSDKVKLPQGWTPWRPFLLSSPNSRYPFYAKIRRKS